MATMHRWVFGFLKMMKVFWTSPGTTFDRTMSEVNAIRRHLGLKPFDL